MVGLSPNQIETSVKAVRFSRNGPLETVSFPFTMDIYAWRILCHTPVDGSVKYHKTIRALPEIKWAQEEKHQKPMLTILKRWNPLVKNSGMDIKYPKVLTCTMLGSMPGIVFSALRSSNFIKFILNHPLSYRDFKVQFLVAFLVDDGSIGKSI